MWEGEKVLRSIRECIEDDLPLDAPKKAVTVQIYDADPEDVERLVKMGRYRLACVCGTQKGTARLVAVKETEECGFMISNAVFSQLVAEDTYYRLKESLSGES